MWLEVKYISINGKNHERYPDPFTIDPMSTRDGSVLSDHQDPGTTPGERVEAKG